MKSVAVTFLALSFVVSSPSVSLAKPARPKAQPVASREQMAESIRQRGWLGVEFARSATSANLTVLTVTAGGPADQAGLKAGDVIVGAEGVRYDEANSTQIAQLNQSMKPGSLIAYMVQAGQSTREVKATLGKIPDEVLVRMLGESSASKS